VCGPRLVARRLLVRGVFARGFQRGVVDAILLLLGKRRVVGVAHALERGARAIKRSFARDTQSSSAASAAAAA
jgi:hypothetical protein